jgi:hypothetical protein
VKPQHRVMHFGVVDQLVPDHQIVLRSLQQLTRKLKPGHTPPALP